MKRFVDLDPIDRKIVTLLQHDATISHADLGEFVGTSGPSCWRRIKMLEAAGILGKTVRLVDAAAVDLSVNALCNIRMASHAKTVRDPFEAWTQTQPQIVECFSTTGDWDYLLRIVTSDVATYNDYLMDELLTHASVAGASSHFALKLVKHTTALPVQQAPRQLPK